MSDEFVLELEHITKEYPGVLALNDVSLQLKKGEVLALIGENGAGKSTLIKTCSGAVIPTSGKIRVNGKEYSRMTPQRAAENGIAIIYQEFNNVGELSAAENLFLGRAIRKGPIIDMRAMEKAAADVFAQLKIDINPRQLVKNLTVGYQQMVEIAKAIQQNAKVLIMDEPTAPLTTKEVQNLFEVIELLRKRGVSIVYISHRLDEIFALSDRIEVLRDGQFIKTLVTKDSNVDELIKLMIGREMTQQFPARPDTIDKNKVVLECKNVSGNGDRDVSLKIHAGEVVGLGGLVGAGRTEFAEILFGYAKKEAGQIFLNGKEINPEHPADAIAAGIALVPEDRKRHGVLLGTTIAKNINMPIYKRISTASVINQKIEKETADKFCKEIQIKTPSIHQTAGNLSGGNQQKVVLAKWLAADSELIIFDEPTRGIDVGAKYEIYKLINELVAQGRAVLMISSEMEELIGMSDRIVVFAENVVTGELKKSEFSPERVMAFASSIIDNQ